MADEYELKGIVISVESKSGTSPKGDWNKATLKIETPDGKTKTIGTFDTNDIETANQANGKTVEVTYVVSGNFNNLVKGGIKVVPDKSESVLEEEKIGETNKYPEAKPGERPVGAEVTQPSTEPRKDMDTVNKFKTADADKYMLGMALNNAARLLSNSAGAIYQDGQSGKTGNDPDLTVYWELVDKLYLEGREIRKKHLGV